MCDVLFTVLALFCIYFKLTIDFFSPSESQFHSYAKKIDFKSTINYLFCKRALFLFAYNFVKKMFNPKLLNFRIKKMKRVVANHETEHVGRDKKREKTSKRPAVKISFLVEHNQHLKEMGKQREPTRT